MPRLRDIVIQEEDDRVVFAQIITDMGSIDFVAEVYKDGNDLIVKGAHVGTLGIGIIETHLLTLACQILRVCPKSSYGSAKLS